MNNPRQIAMGVAVLLAVGLAVAWFNRQSVPAPVAVPAAAAPEPLPSGAVSNAPQPATAQAAPAAAVQASPDEGEATPEFVTEPVTEPAADGLHDHGEQDTKPSQATIDAIREIRKPAPNEGQVITHPDGTVEANLGNRFRSVPVATIGKDGKVHVDYHGEKYLEESVPQNAEEQKTGEQQP
jgi:hypothetical protein